MVGIEISKQAHAKEFSERLEEDRLSQLPDPLLCQILSHLPTKKAVSTSVLSTRWKSLWLWLPHLELNSRKFSDLNAFKSFGDKFFDSSMVSYLHELTITLGSNARNESYIQSWIDAAIKRKIQNLDVRWSSKFNLDENPLRLYNCETLVYLRLFDVILNDSVFVVLPCLKTMWLEKNWYPSDNTLEKIISSCPVLENLKIAAADNDTTDYRVHSRSLKRLHIERTHPVLNIVPGVVIIDAPLLRCLTIRDQVSEILLVNNLESNAKLHISLDFGLGRNDVDESIKRVSSRKGCIRDFLPGISMVGNMKICPDTFELICRYSELEPLPQFGYMSRLCISLYAFNIKWLGRFLQSFPNLKSLILMIEVAYYYRALKEPNQISFSSDPPECLLSSLEFVDLKLSTWGHADEMKLIIKYFLENSAILKKLTLRSANHSTKDEFCKEVYEIPRSSTKCEVIIL